MGSLSRVSLDLSPDDLRPSIDSRLAWALAALLLAVHVALCWLARDPGVLLMRDDARYLILATSLGQGEYNDLFLATGAAHSLYPPVFPALLLTWGSITGGQFDAYLAINIILSAAALALVFASVKRLWGPLAGLACLAPLCVNPLLIERAGGLRSETAYMFFSLAALWALARARPATQTLVVAAVAALLAALTRTVGVTLVAAIILVWLHERRYKAVAALGVATLLTIGVWLAWTVVAPQQHAGSNYIGDIVVTAAGDQPDWKAILWKRTGVRLSGYFGTRIPWALAVPTIPGTPLDNVISSLAVLTGLLSGLLVLFKRWRVAALYLALYSIALLVYPFQRLRFLEPVIPLLVPALLLGAAALAGRIRSGWAARTIVIAGILLAAGGAIRSAPLVTQRMSCGPFDLADPPSCLSDGQRSFLQAVHYVSVHTNPEDVFVTKMPETLYYYTGRRSIDAELAMTVRPQAFLQFLDEKGVSWALLTARSPSLASYLRLHCEAIDLEEVFERRTVLFRVPSGMPADGAPTAGGPSDGGARDACQALDDYLSAFESGGGDPTIE